MKFVHHKETRLVYLRHNQNFKIFRARSFHHDYHGIGILLFLHEFGILWKVKR